MATFLDVTGLAFFSAIFVFLFTWIVAFAMLQWVKVLGGNKFIDALAGLLLAIFVVISSTATSIIAGTAPFIAVILVFIVLLSVIARMLGGDIEAFPAVKAVLIVFIILMIIISVAITIRDKAEQAGTTDTSKASNLIFNPRFLGSILVMAIAVFTIALLASKTTA